MINGKIRLIVVAAVPASATFTADKAGTPNCGQVCHVAVKAKDYVFHPYQMR